MAVVLSERPAADAARPHGGDRRFDSPWAADSREHSVGPCNVLPEEQERPGAVSPAQLPAGDRSAAAAPVVVAAAAGSPKARGAGGAGRQQGPGRARAEAELATESVASGTAERLPPRTACAAALEGEEEAVADASTTASLSEPPPESPRVRWADLAESEEDDEAPETLPQARKSTARQHSATRARWADLEDSDDEQAPPRVGCLPEAVQQGGSSSSSKPRAPPTAAAAPEPAAEVPKPWHGGATTEQRSRNGTRPPAAGNAAPAPAAPAGSGRSAGARWGSGAGKASHAGHGRWQEKSSYPSGAWSGAGWDQASYGGYGQWQGKASYSSGAHTGAGWKQAGWHSRPEGFAKPQCQFMIGIEEEPEFQVKRKLLGPHGQHMKSIAEKSGAKLRLRGRGSGFLEGPEERESPDPLMLCVSAPDAWSYGEAVRLVRELLDRVHVDYRRFAERAGRPAPELRVEVHEGPRPGSF